MESPASWGEAQHIISETLQAAEEAHQKGVIGASKATQVFNALVAAGLLKDDRENLPQDEAWKKFRERLDKRSKPV